MRNSQRQTRLDGDQLHEGERAYARFKAHIAVCSRCQGELILAPVFARVRQQQAQDPELCAAGDRLMASLCAVLSL